MNAAAPHPPLNAGEILAETNYLRERCRPSRRDPSYLILSDLWRLFSLEAPQIGGRVFDYGCGGAPYKPLFKQCSSYTGADMVAGPATDLVLSPDGLTAEPPGKYDAILSAQVLEHVQEPASYLDECARILKPGGTLLLTTHGLFLEHKCPDDLWRWTAQGLEKLASSAGFEPLRSFKITSGARGGIQMLHYMAEELRHQPPSAISLPLRVFRKAYQLACMPVLNAAADWFFSPQAFVPGDDPTHLYIGVGILARKG